MTSQVKKPEIKNLYRELTQECGFELCVFCKFNYGYACSGPNCKHPLGYRFDHEGLEPGSDCWGFRPNQPIDFVAEIAGFILSHKWDGAIFWEEDGQIKIAEFEG